MCRSTSIHYLQCKHTTTKLFPCVLDCKVYEEAPLGIVGTLFFFCPACMQSNPMPRLSRVWNISFPVERFREVISVFNNRYAMDHASGSSTHIDRTNVHALKPYGMVTAEGLIWLIRIVKAMETVLLAYPQLVSNLSRPEQIMLFLQLREALIDAFERKRLDVIYGDNELKGLAEEYLCFCLGGPDKLHEGEDDEGEPVYKKNRDPGFPLFELLDPFLESTDEDEQPLDDNMCMICYEEFEESWGPKGACRITICNHVFGRACIERWITEAEQPNCPLCRTDFGRPMDEEWMSNPENISPDRVAVLRRVVAEYGPDRQNPWWLPMLRGR